jgi:serine/threonine protein kinase
MDMNLREAQVWSKISVHRNIASYLCCGTYEKNFYILSKKYNRTLASIEQKDLSNEFLFKIISGLINALLFANRKIGLIHRDIKPQNLFLDDNNELKIGDFGLSSYFNRHLVFSKDLSSIKTINILSKAGYGGTIPFMSPEILIENEDFGIAGDIYAIGVTLFNILTNGLFPYNIPGFEANDYANKLFESLHLASEIKYFIRKCIACEPSKRYLSYEEIADDLHIEINPNSSLNDISASVNYIQTLRRTGQVARAELLVTDLLAIYTNNPSIINQKALIELDKGNREKYIAILEDCLKSNKNRISKELLDPFFNIAGYFFTHDVVKMKELFIKYNYLFDHEDKIFIRRFYPEYAVYQALCGNLKDAFSTLRFHILNKNISGTYLSLLFVIGIKLNSVSEVIEIAATVDNELSREVISLCRNSSEKELRTITNEISRELFGGLI